MGKWTGERAGMWRNVHPLRINGPALPSQKKVNFFKDFWVTPPPPCGHGTKFLTPLGPAKIFLSCRTHEHGIFFVQPEVVMAPRLASTHDLASKATSRII